MTYKTDLNLIRALISFYSIDDQCFDINGVKISPTLDDVARIMGFPVDEKPVTGLDYNSEDSKILCSRLLGAGNFIGEKTKCSLKLEVLRENFEHLPEVPCD
ncbi:protein MAIN-LIKE 1-like [Forsythia ovata]|uniref:Protein MAIN-LIKE 1-like n=1 Tax=Forsythia ovata TaxID=205694 RepID=A0ABD1PWG2_9LAMI